MHASPETLNNPLPERKSERDKTFSGGNQGIYNTFKGLVN